MPVCALAACSRSGSFLRLAPPGDAVPSYCKPDKVVDGQELAPHQVTEFPTDDVAYISDKVGMHRISNASHSIRAVSLHLYSPPYQKCKSCKNISAALNHRSGIPSLLPSSSLPLPPDIS